MAKAEAERQTHILVVNDTPEILELFRELLEGEGYRVSLYSYAFRDLEEIKRVGPDLLILDFMIAGEDHGWQLLQKLKMDRATADLPVILCTAAVSVVRELEGHLREKNVTVVLKPFDIDELLVEVAPPSRSITGSSALPTPWRRSPSDGVDTPSGPRRG